MTPRPRRIVTSDPRGRWEPEGRGWCGFVEGILDKRTGEIIPKRNVFLVDEHAGLIGRYLEDEGGEPYIVQATEEIPRPHIAHEWIPGAFAILWSEDAPG